MKYYLVMSSYDYHNQIQCRISKLNVSYNTINFYDLEEKDYKTLKGELQGTLKGKLLNKCTICFAGPDLIDKQFNLNKLGKKIFSAIRKVGDIGKAFKYLSQQDKKRNLQLIAAGVVGVLALSISIALDRSLAMLCLRIVGSSILFLSLAAGLLVYRENKKAFHTHTYVLHADIKKNNISAAK